MCHLTEVCLDFPKLHKLRFWRYASKGDMGCVYNVRMDVYCSLSIYLSNYAPFSRNSLPPPQISVLRSVVSDAIKACPFVGQLVGWALFLS